MKILLALMIGFSATGPLTLDAAAPANGGLVALKAVNPRIRQDLRYASADNFTKAVVYDFSSCWLRPEAAHALDRAQKALEARGLGLKVWDCYRPMSAQKRFWELVPDPRYVSPPGKGGRHTRGTAVDLTLVDKQGKELQMPTAFDDFSPAAHRAARGGPAQSRANSSLLEKTMQAQGFIGLSTEWWHFDLAGFERHPPVDVNIKALEQGQVS